MTAEPRTRTRLLYLVAAAMTAAALVAPLWGFAMSAAQYPDETLHLRVGRGGIVGDVHEIQTLQHYVGVTFPTNLPELRWATWAIVVLTIALGAGAFAGDGRGGRIYRVACSAALVAFLVASAGVVQARLYKVGHERAANAPFRALHDFTPPLIGPVRVANFTVWSYPHAGGVLLLGSAVLSIAGLKSRRLTRTARGRRGQRQAPREEAA